MFKFLDETVRGLVQFIFDLLGSTFTLLLHPFSGATKLYRADRTPEKQQISSVTYLTLALLPPLVVVPALLYADRPDGFAQEFTSRAVSFLVTGSPPQGFAPYAVGAIGGAVLAAALFRMAAWLRGLEGRRRKRLIVTMEYQTGIFILAATAWLPFALDRQPGVALQFLYALSGLLLAVHINAFVCQFWAGLLRSATPYQVARLWARAWRHLLRGDIAGWRANQQQAKFRALGYSRDEKPRLDRRWLIQSLLVSASILVPAVVAGGAILSSSLVSEWLLAQEARTGARSD